MKHTIKFVYVTAFILILMLPLLFLNTQENAVSEVDNRTLVEMPEWTDQNFSQDFESYLKDRVGFRNEMINAYAVLNDNVVGELTHPIYTYGKDGYVFFGMHQNVEYSDFMRAFADMVLKLQEYCESRGSEFYFMFEPEKISVLRDYLPEGVNYNDDWVDELFDYLSSLGVNCINNTQILSEKEKDEDVFNKQYDAGHWNDLGCFYATNQLFERMHDDYPLVTPMDKSEFTITEKTETQLPVSQFQIEEQVPNFISNTNYTDVSSEYTAEVEVNDSYRHFHYYINDEENAEDLPKVLMFQGSYYNGNGRSKFLTSRTSEIIGVHNYQNVLDLDYYYNIFQPDAVVFEVAEYTFSNTYFDYEKMCDLEFNPSLVDVLNENSTMTEVVGNSTQFEDELLVSISEGSAVDKVSIDKQFSDAEYAYMIIDGKVYDLSRNENNKLEASLLHGVLNESDSLIIFLKGIDGKQYSIQTTAYVVKEFDGEPIASPNVDIQAEKAIMTTNVEGNSFNSVHWQLIDGVSGNYLETLSEIQNAGEVSSSYIHNRESGWYLLRLKGNTHLQDEYMDYPVYLVRGKEYGYSCVIEELLPEKITLKDVSISGFFPKEDQN